MKTRKLKLSVFFIMLLSSNFIKAQYDDPTSNWPLDGNDLHEAVKSDPCITGASPWALGGNIVVSTGGAITNYTNGISSVSPIIIQNNIGTCNNFPFILKSNNAQSIFLNPDSKVGIGLNNTSPGAALDIRNTDLTNPNNISNFRIYGDLHGNLESTEEINMNFAQGKTFKINEGTTTNNLNWLAITSGGNVGLGTNAPTAKLSLEAYEYQTTLGANVTSAIKISNLYANSFGTRSELQFALGQNSNQEIAVIAAEYSDYNNGVGGDIVFGTAKGAVISEKMRINYDGQVWVGKRPTTGIHSSTFNFAAEKILAKEIYVTLQGNWADYVFDKNYALPKLSEVESFYQKNHHLPEIPSAKEVEENGISIGDMNALLLKKIEELTLYVVDQQKEIESLKEKVK